MQNNQIEILKDSLNLITNDRLTTFRLLFPKCLLAELNTHRMLSRSVSSSRAVSFKNIRKRVIENPYKPLGWDADQKGMQASSELSGWRSLVAASAWELHKYSSMFCHWLAGDVAGLHKQHSNRLIETHLFAEVIISGTEWDNFFKLRAHEAAQPEFAHIAKQMMSLYETNIPDYLRPGDWHLPLIFAHDIDLNSSEQLRQISAARCARASYYTQEGKVASYEADLKLCERLAGSEPKHLSPFEHQAQALETSERIGNFQGWKQYRKFLEVSSKSQL